jgi:PAS domain S-box-containing protein
MAVGRPDPELMAFLRERLDRISEFQHSRDQLQVILEGVADGIAIQDPTGELVYANDAAARLIGFPNAKILLETPVAEVWRPFEVFDEWERPVQPSELPGRRALLGETVNDVILRFRRSGSEDERWALVSAAPIADGAEGVQFAVNVFRDITEPKVAEERLLFLAKAGEILASSLDSQTTLTRLADLVVPKLADWCAVDMLDESGQLRSVIVAHSDSEKVEWARHLRKRYPPKPDAPRGVPHVLRTGRSELYAEIPPEALEDVAEDEDHLRILKDIGLSSVMIVPLLAEGQPIGALTFVSSRPRRRFGSEDLVLAEELARRAGLAIENARLHEAERRARRAAELAADRTSRLQSITAALADAMESEGVASVVVQQGLQALGASGAALCLLSDDGESLKLLRPAGYEEPLLEGFDRIPLDAPLPLAEAVREREAVFVRSPDDLARRYPGIASAPERSGNGAWAALPLLIKESVIGAVGFSFERPHSFSRMDRTFMLALAQQAAEALDRNRSYRIEQEARARAEALSLRLLQLESISEIALTHLDLRSLVSQLLERIRTILGADRAVLLLRENDDLLVHTALGLEDEVARTVRVPIGRGIAGRIAAQATPLVVEDVPAADPVSPYLRERARSLAGVPLFREGEVFGVLHVSSDIRRRFTADEVRLLELVASRAALAINQSQVYEQEHRIAETLQRSLLPDRLPQVEGVQIAARYLPSGLAMEVGGDWYDAIALTDGRMGLAVGDVVGHGLRAAAVMGQVRNAIRAYAADGYSPSEILQRVERAVPLAEREAIATALCLLIDLRSCEITYSSAGHPPPLLLPPGEKPRFLEEARAVPLGVIDSPDFPEAVDYMAPGSSLLLYTDGLVESRDLPIDAGMARLAEAAASVEGGAEEMADHVVRSLVVGGSTEDDVALVVARLDPPLPC